MVLTFFGKSTTNSKQTISNQSRAMNKMQQDEVVLTEGEVRRGPPWREVASG